MASCWHYARANLPTCILDPIKSFLCIKSKHTRIIKNYEFKKGSRDRSPQQKVMKLDRLVANTNPSKIYCRFNPYFDWLRIQILVKFTRFNPYFGFFVALYVSQSRD